MAKTIRVDWVRNLFNDVFFVNVITSKMKLLGTDQVELNETARE